MHRLRLAQLSLRRLGVAASLQAASRWWRVPRRRSTVPLPVESRSRPALQLRSVGRLEAAHSRNPGPRSRLVGRPLAGSHQCRSLLRQLVVVRLPGTGRQRSLLLAAVVQPVAARPARRLRPSRSVAALPAGTRRPTACPPEIPSRLAARWLAGSRRASWYQPPSTVPLPVVSCSRREPQEVLAAVPVAASHRMCGLATPVVVPQVAGAGVLHSCQPRQVALCAPAAPPRTAQRRSPGGNLMRRTRCKWCCATTRPAPPPERHVH